ncbi:MAG: hypothetical protein IKN54_06285 [Lachnospiraceae bacterium]|nr:hypothetical protein [Lachnospiraceae bacterium]
MNPESITHLKTAIFPCDMRQYYISEYLTKMGMQNEIIDTYKTFDIYVTATPFSKDNIHVNTILNRPLPISEFIDNLSSDSIVFGGSIKRDIFSSLTTKTKHVYDYLSDKDIVRYNANLTANGLLHDIIEHTPFSLLSSNVFIIGYGNCGRSIASLLSNLVKSIYIYDHTESNIERVINDGYNEIYYNEIKNKLSKFNVIINTVPDVVLTDELLSAADKSSFFFEIASYPFGFKKHIFDQLNLNLVYCLGLPGKYTPLDAGFKIAEYIYNQMKGYDKIHDS